MWGTAEQSAAQRSKSATDSSAAFLTVPGGGDGGRAGGEIRGKPAYYVRTALLPAELRTTNFIHFFEIARVAPINRQVCAITGGGGKRGSKPRAAQ